MWRARLVSRLTSKRCVSTWIIDPVDIPQTSASSATKRPADKRLSISKVTAITESSLTSLYSSPPIQRLLHDLNEFYDTRQVFVQDLISDRAEDPKFQMMTDEELKETLARVEGSARERLRPAPLMAAADVESITLADDVEINGFDSANFVFTDISPGLTDHTRNVVVREPSGRLRTATPAERGRVNRTYYEKPFSNVYLPKAFFEPYLTEMLSKEKHRHLLDWACYLLEPNDPVFVRIMTTVFDYVNKHGIHSTVWSSRHWPMYIFYLTINRKADGVLMYLAEQQRMEEMWILAKMHAECFADSRLGDEEDKAKLIQQFVKLAYKDNARLSQLAGTMAKGKKEADTVQKSYFSQQ